MLLSRPADRGELSRFIPSFEAWHTESVLDYYRPGSSFLGDTIGGDFTVASIPGLVIEDNHGGMK